MRARLIGVVTGDKNDKTRRVEVARLFQHPKYLKIVRGRTVCHAHDEANESHVGDTVEIEESRPLSKTKRWKLVSVVRKAEMVETGRPAPEEEVAGNAGETAE